MAARQTGDRDRPWLGCGLPAGLHPDLLGQDIPANLTPEGTYARHCVLCTPSTERPRPLPRSGVFACSSRVTPATPLAFVRRSMGGVRPSLRPRDSPLALRAGLPAQHGPACGPGGRYPLAPGPQRAQCLAVSSCPDGTGQRSCSLDPTAMAPQSVPSLIRCDCYFFGHRSRPAPQRSVISTRQEGPYRPPRCCHPRTISAKHQSPRISGALSDEPLPVLLSEQLRWPYRRIFLGFVVAHGHGLARVGRASG